MSQNAGGTTLEAELGIAAKEDGSGDAAAPIADGKSIAFIMPPKDADAPNTRYAAAIRFQQDAPSCSDSGSSMMRNGACHECLNCGSTSGCP